MSPRIELSQAALKALEDIPRTELKKIQKKIDALEQNPRLPKTEKLSGHENLYRIRSGDYRIVYQIYDKKLIVLVVTIGHRREVYRNL